MKLTEYFQLSLDERIAREKAREILCPKPVAEEKLYTLDDYYATGDSVNFLEQLRAYQLADILGRYKVF